MSSTPSFQGRSLRSRGQRGVALITAVLVVALATVLAVNVGFKGYLDQRRSATTFALDQSYEVALGGEAWAADALRRDKQRGGQGQGQQTDDLSEEWATPIPPIPIEGGEFQGQLEDMQGRFNLNNLVKLEGNDYVRDEEALKRFVRLLRNLEIEEKWAGIIVDWIDSDTNAEFPEGAEDSVYTGLTPAYRTANMPITRASELLAITEFGLERYRKLEPFVTALPTGTTINLCTASPELLDSLIEGETEYMHSRENTTEMRKQRCFPDEQTFVNRERDQQKQEALKAAVDVKSSYFRSTIWVTIGTTEFTLYSLLYRSDNAALVSPILRSHGTP